MSFDDHADPGFELRIEGLSKRFPGVTALDGVDLRLRSGRVVGIFGNNGAGKSTLARILAGIMTPDGGRVLIGGRDLATARRRWGPRMGIATADERSFYARLDGTQNLRLFGALRGLDPAQCRARSESWAARLGLTEVMARPFQTWSSGQRQRLNLIRALLHEPALVILDEALRSTDPATVDGVRKLLREEAHGRGRLILYTGHDFHGLHDLCDDVVVLDRGRVVLAGDAREVLAGLVAPAWRVSFPSPEARERALAARPEFEPGEDDRSALWARDGDALPAALARWVSEAGADLGSLERRVGLSVRELLLRLAAGDARGLDRVGSAPVAAGESVRGALPSGRGAPGALRILRAVWARDRAIHLSYRFKLAMQVVLMLVWATLLFYLARMVDSDLTERLHGDPFAFLIFGLAALQLSQICLLHAGYALREEQLTGTLESLLSTGVSPGLLAICSLVWPLTIGLVGVGALLLAGVGLFGVDLSGANWPAVALATGVGAVVLCALGLLSASFVLAFKRGDPVAVVLNLLSLVVAGAYFPRDLLPDFLVRLGSWIPHTHALEAVRLAALEGAGLEDPGYRAALTALGLSLLVLVPLALGVWGVALRYARRRGCLCHA
jgi:ABC-type multidrug transport system ATPase subunit/ABC-type multidrug transport system permease subunit